MTQGIPQLHERRRLFAAQQFHAEIMGDKGEAAANRVRVDQIDNRLRELARHERHAQDAAILMINAASRAGKPDAIALMCKRKQLTAIQARAAMALRDVHESAQTGKSPMADMDVTSRSSACDIGLEVMIDHTRAKLAAEAAAFDWIRKPRLRRAVRLVVLYGWAPKRAAQREGLSANGVALRQIREMTGDALGRAVSHFGIAA